MLSESQTFNLCGWKLETSVQSRLVNWEVCFSFCLLPFNDAWFYWSVIRSILMSLSPEKEVVVVVFGDTVGEAGEVSETGDVKPWSGGDLQHAAPRLVAQQLDLGGVEKVGVVVPRQVVVGAVGLLVQGQHFGKDYDLSQFGTARFCLRSPVVGQLTRQAPTRTDCCQDKRQDNPHDPAGRGDDETVWEGRNAAEGSQWRAHRKLCWALHCVHISSASLQMTSVRCFDVLFCVPCCTRTMLAITGQTFRTISIPCRRNRAAHRHQIERSRIKASTHFWLRIKSLQILTGIQDDKKKEHKKVLAANKTINNYV